jgi:hypothetical protein
LLLLEPVCYFQIKKYNKSREPDIHTQRKPYVLAALWNTPNGNCNSNQTGFYDREVHNAPVKFIQKNTLFNKRDFDPRLGRRMTVSMEKGRKYEKCWFYQVLI